MIISIKQCTPVRNFSQFENFQICAKFQLIWRTLYSGTKFAPQKYESQNCKKVNIKFKIRISQCTTAPNYSQFGKLQFLGPNLSQNTLGWSSSTNATWEQLILSKKSKHQIRNKDIAMYYCTRFQSLWRISVSGTKFAPKHLWLEY